MEDATFHTSQIWFSSQHRWWHLPIHLSHLVAGKEGQNLLMSSQLLMVVLSLEQSNHHNNDTSCLLSGER